jgi:MurNAc alpha-1-phosphate uridylyltransferase
VAAGFTDLVINVAHLGEQIEAALGGGSKFGATICYSREPEPLEVAGGIATALPLLGDGIALVVSADIHTDYDYASLRGRARAMAASGEAARMHMVMVPNPDYHPQGDFALAEGRLQLNGAPRYTFASFGLYDLALFNALPRGRKAKIRPLYDDWIGRGWVSGELFTGRWANVGTLDDLTRLDASLHSAQPSTP